MKTFKFAADLDRIRNDPFHATTEELVVPHVTKFFESQFPYDPEYDGHLVLI